MTRLAVVLSQLGDPPDAGLDSQLQKQHQGQGNGDMHSRMDAGEYELRGQAATPCTACQEAIS